MTKFEPFKPEDFVNDSGDLLFVDEYELAEIANAKIAPLLARLQELEELIENAPTVLCKDKGMWLSKEQHSHYEVTHTAKLICIEEIKK